MCVWCSRRPKYLVSGAFLVTLRCPWDSPGPHHASPCLVIAPCLTHGHTNSPRSDTSAKSSGMSTYILIYRCLWVTEAACRTASQLVAHHLKFTYSRLMIQGFA